MSKHLNDLGLEVEGLAISLRTALEALNFWTENNHDMETWEKNNAKVSNLAVIENELARLSGVAYSISEKVKALSDKKTQYVLSK